MMLQKAKARCSADLRARTSIWLAIVLLLALPMRPSRTNARQPDYRIRLVPDQMTLAGDVTTRANCADPTVCSWLHDTPPGTIILGVDPSSSLPSSWDGSSATAKVHLQDVYSPTLLLLRVSWPNYYGKGIHSPIKNREVTITLDDQLLWSKRTIAPGAFGNFYAAEQPPVLTTIVITRSAEYDLTFSVPANTVWDLSTIELSAHPYPSTIKGVGYSPFRDCQYPGGALQPSPSEIAEDLFRLSHTTNAIRTYSSIGVNSTIPAMANEVGLPVFAGAWIDYPHTTMAEDDAEIDALIELACTADPEGLIIGNEYFLRSQRRPEDADYLLRRVRDVKEGVRARCGKDVPITTAEIDNLMFAWETGTSSEIRGIQPIFRAILDEIDFVMPHTYPFWNGMLLEGAAAFTVDRYGAIKALLDKEYPGQNRRVIIGEAGWPSAGHPNGEAIPSLDNQRRYMVELLRLADDKQVELLYFYAFDELWKIKEPGRVGQNWGYSYTDRAAKHGFHGVLLPVRDIWSSEAYLPYVAGASSKDTRAASTNLPVAPEPACAMRPAGTVVFPLFNEWPMEPENYVPSGWMGDTGNIDVYECDRSNPRSGQMAIRVSLDLTGTLGWGGVYWQHPENNWGDLEGGHSLAGSSRLTVWVRGDQGGEVVEFLVGGIGETGDPYRDTVRPARSSGPVVLSREWQKVEINLEGADLSRVIGGFAWVAGQCHNDDAITFYLDDIMFESGAAPDPGPSPERRPFYVYLDGGSECNRFVPSGWMGDIDDISIDPEWIHNPHRGDSAIRINYSALESYGRGWAGVYWQEPEGNWGDIDGGFDLSWATRLRFWARGENGGESVRFFVGGIGDQQAAYPDSLMPAATTGFVSLKPTWQEYTIDLADKDLTRVIGGFGWVAGKSSNPGGAVFYLDEIRFEAGDG